MKHTIQVRKHNFFQSATMQYHIVRCSCGLHTSSTSQAEARKTAADHLNSLPDSDTSASELEWA